MSPAIGLVAHLGFGFPLVDRQLARIDSWFGVNTPAIQTWSRGNEFGRTVIAGYGSILFFVIAAFFLPLLVRRIRAVRIFLAANIFSFLIAYPMLFIVPAVGPWFAYHTIPTPGQKMVESALLALRQPGACTLGNTAVICIPSFHVIWAIICAYALWSVRWMRIPALLIAALLIFSTLATGWHYFIDVISGAAVASVSLRLAIAYVRVAGSCLQAKETRVPALAGVIEA